jgi:hypothetical protein
MVDLEPGSVLVYCETSSLARLGAKHPEDPQIAAADAAWRLALEGRVDLLQRRSGNGIQYVLVGRYEVDRRPVLPALNVAEERRAA